MNIKLSNIIIFATGVAIGSVVTWKLTKDKYVQILQESIDSVKEMYEEGVVEEDGAEKEKDEEGEYDDSTDSPALNEMRTAYSNIVNDSGYTEGYLKEKEVSDVEKPYIITPEEFDSIDYNTESLNYYADGVLTDQFDNIIDYPEDIIGNINPADHFGEYEDDSVYVRNDVTQCDYEILRDTRKYSEVYPDVED